MSAVALQLRGVSKRFPARRSLLETIRRPRTRSTIEAVRNVTCDIREGEFFGLLGQNGAGKTSLFRILSTLVAPDSGSATILGADVVRDAALVRSYVAPVFTSDRSLYWRLSAVENLRLFAVLQQLDRAEGDRRVREALERVGLEGTGARMVGTFSAGMKQRLLLARALLGRPRVLLLDEPTRSLDPIAARAFRVFLREQIGQGAACTVVVATHDPDEVRELCDRVGVLHHGQLVAEGTRHELAAGLEVGRYRLTSRTVSPELQASLREAGATILSEDASEESGWFEYQLELAQDAASSAGVLTRLQQGGVTVARFERVELPLADLIERVAHRGAGHA
ncbi:MAG TPA: ABC transporter ATP-binding protein [Gemmatimonadales bacterium]|nr:ABC transporter ATP-binding protein [Gemmatimonadales bacterium]